jgi:hypothetical protein
VSARSSSDRTSPNDIPARCWSSRTTRTRSEETTQPSLSTRRDQGATKARPRRDQGATKARPSRDYNTLRVSKVVEDEAGDHKRIPNLLGRCQMADGVGNWSAGGAVGQLCSLSLDEGDDLTIA